MRWQRELIGAIVALSVAVVGGVLVYYLTTGPAKRGEDLTYEEAPLVSFSGSDKTVSIGSVRYANVGGTAAANVAATFSVTGAKIVGLQATRMRGPKPVGRIAPDQSSATVSIPKLLPGESIQATYLLDKKGEASFDLRSDESMGRPNETPSGDNGKRDKRGPALATLVIFTAIIGLMLHQLRRLLKRQPSRGENRNNNAFVLLHTGQSAEAVDLLSKAVQQGQDGSIAMANLAGALAETGQLEEARKYLKASRFLAETPHQVAIVELNAALLAYRAGNREDAVSAMKNSISKSPKEIKGYAAHSSIVQALMEFDSRIKDLFAKN